MKARTCSKGLMLQNIHKEIPRPVYTENGTPELLYQGTIIPGLAICNLHTQVHELQII